MIIIKMCFVHLWKRVVDVKKNIYIYWLNLCTTLNYFNQENKTNIGGGIFFFFFFCSILLFWKILMLHCCSWPRNRELGPSKRTSFVKRFVSVDFFFLFFFREKELFFFSISYTSINVNIQGWMSAIMDLECSTPTKNSQQGNGNGTKEVLNCSGLAQCSFSCLGVF